MQETKVVIKNKVGLHARPAAFFVRKASEHKCKVSVIVGDKEVNAKSILQVLSLGVRAGQEITIRADGEGEAEAVSSLKRFVEEGLGEEVD
jgi:phosphocarrier protein HPr